MMSLGAKDATESRYGRSVAFLFGNIGLRDRVFAEADNQQVVRQKET
jgi:hypothetical protein